MANSIAYQYHPRQHALAEPIHTAIKCAAIVSVPTPPISYVSESSADEGMVTVAIDGVVQQTITAQSRYHNLANQVLYNISGLPVGQHNITLTRASGTYMLLDAFIVQTQARPVVRTLGHTVNDTDPTVRYIGLSWFYNGGRPASFGDVNNDVHATTNNGDLVEFTFTGPGVTYIGEKDVNSGTMDVWIDGVQQPSVNAYAPVHNEGGQVLFSASNLTPGFHTLLIKKTSGLYMVVDAFTYQQLLP